MRNKQHLKRCPFCGGKAGIYQDYHDFHLVQCNQCGASTLHRKDVKTAVLDWNRRIESNVRANKNHIKGK